MKQRPTRSLSLRLAGLFCVSVAARAAAGLPADALIVRSAPHHCREVALTFDLCPVRRGSGFDEPLIDELVAERIPATFFLSGRWMASHDAAVRKLLAVPFFEVETHGFVHAHLAGLDAAAQRREIEEPLDVLRSRYAHDSGFFRPPYGEYDGTTLDVARSLGLRVVLWSAASGDPDPHLSEQQILTGLLPRVRDGSVLVFHANGRGWRTREVIQDLYERLGERHLRPVTLAEMVDGCTPEP